MIWPTKNLTDLRAAQWTGWVTHAQNFSNLQSTLQIATTSLPREEEFVCSCKWNEVQDMLKRKSVLNGNIHMTGTLTRHIYLLDICIDIAVPRISKRTNDDVLGLRLITRSLSNDERTEQKDKWLLAFRWQFIVTKVQMRTAMASRSSSCRNPNRYF
jgi:hypothetical protein